MAFDEWMLEQVMHSPGAAKLRLYSWHPAGITFGFNQRLETAIDWRKVGETSAIRRVTGGRALFHDQSELTYSIAVNMQEQGSARLVGSLSAVSANLSEALGQFLGRVGILARYERQSAPENAQPAFFHKAPCFASAAKYELMAGGQKVVASAQKRLGDALLQHGSIKLAGVCRHPALDTDVERIDDFLPAIGETDFRQHADLFRQVMSTGLGVVFAPAVCDIAQKQRIAELVDRVSLAPCERREIIKQSGDASSL